MAGGLGGQFPFNPAFDYGQVNYTVFGRAVEFLQATVTEFG